MRLLPENAQYYCLRASVYMEIGEHANAEQDLEAAMRFDSDSAEPFVIRALSYARRGDFQKVLEDSDRGIELQPELE